MRKKEQRLWDRMRNSLIDQLYLERMENVVQPGRPDIDSMWDGIFFPIELKSLDRYPKRSTTPVLGTRHGLNQNQLNWWLRWRRWGGRGFIVVGVERDVFIIPGNKSEIVNTLTRPQLQRYEGKWIQLIRAIKLETLCVQRP